MWIVTLANNSEFLRKELLKKFSNTKIYFPKVKLKKNKIKNILGNYLFCYSENFNSNSNILYNLSNLRGLKKILFADKASQKEITNGPFSNYIFDILSKDKKGIKAVIGGIKFSISDNSKFCYSSI